MRRVPGQWDLQPQAIENCTVQSGLSIRVSTNNLTRNLDRRIDTGVRNRYRCTILRTTTEVGLCTVQNAPQSAQYDGAHR